MKLVYVCAYVVQMVPFPYVLNSVMVRVRVRVRVGVRVTVRVRFRG